MRKNRFALTLLGIAALITTPLALAQTSPAKASTLNDYIVTHPDLRKCAYPLCGGYFVKAVNQARTRCADGTLQKECHAAALDVAATGWTPEERDTFEQELAQGHALVRGTLRAVSEPNLLPPADTLIVIAGWTAQALSKPVGLFYGLKSSGIVCITYPCPSITETTLNFPAQRNIAGVDLAASGAKPELVDAGNQALFSTGILAAGYHKTISGPAGKGQQFVATEFYLPFLAGQTR